MRKNLTLLTLIILGTILGFASKTPAIHLLNLAFSRTLQSWQPSWLVILSECVSILEYGTIIFSLALTAVLLWRKQKQSALLIFLAGSSWIFPILLKLLFTVPCPTAGETLHIMPFYGLIDLSSLCYPSGHVLNYVSLWGTVYFLSNRAWVKGFALFLIVTVGLSRLILGAHLLTDVVGGYLFGFAWLMTLNYFFTHKPRTPSLFH